MTQALFYAMPQDKRAHFLALARWGTCPHCSVPCHDGDSVLCEGCFNYCHVGCVAYVPEGAYFCGCGGCMEEEVEEK